MHHITKRGRHEKVATRLHQWNTRDLVMPQHLCFLNSQCTVKQRIRASVEILEIPGEKDDPERITITPLNLNFSSMDKHSG